MLWPDGSKEPMAAGGASLVVQLLGVSPWLTCAFALIMKKDSQPPFARTTPRRVGLAL